MRYVFEGRPHALYRALRGWMEASPRFTAFVETYRDKVRKKVRVTRGAESALDLGGELEVAFRLLNDRRLEVAYEPYASLRKRSPDFGVTYRTNLTFNVEVARIRDAPGEGEAERLAWVEERLQRVVIDKLGQMQPGMPNLLVVQAGAELGEAPDLGRLMQEMKIRADKRDPAFYAGTPYTRPAEFYRDFLHLSGVVLRGPRAQVWENRQARPGLDGKVLRLVEALLSDAPASG